MKRLSILLLHYFIITLVFFTLLSAFSIVHSANSGYKIKVKIKGMKDKVCYLGNYYGDKQFVKDTAKVGSDGEMIFKGKKNLPKGIYLIVTADKKYFEIIINKEQDFSIETDSSDFVANMKIKGSPENKLFYEYLTFIAKREKEITPLHKKLKALKGIINVKDSTSKIKKLPTDTQLVKDSIKIIQDKMIKIDDEVKNYKENFIKKYPDSFMAEIFLASKDPEVPETPTLPNGKKDSTFPYRYYKKHYFDNINFTDDGILRTPIFHNKINEYMTKIVSPIPDSIIKEAEILIEKTTPNKEMFKYIVWYMTRTYELSNVMGYDKIFVELGKKYYNGKDTTWIAKSIIEAMKKRVKELEPLLVGKKAPNMIMLDTNLSPVSMWDINAKFTILVFWDPECSHCQKEVPKLIKVYNEKKTLYNLEFYAVCTDTSLVKWKKFIKKEKLTWINVDGPRAYTKNFHDLYDIISTPVIYILNEDKEIIAKKLGAEQLEGFLKNYLKQQEKKVN